MPPPIASRVASPNVSYVPPVAPAHPAFTYQQPAPSGASSPIVPGVFPGQASPWASPRAPTMLPTMPQRAVSPVPQRPTMGSVSPAPPQGIPTGYEMKPGDTVELCGLTATTAFNGRKASIVSLDVPNQIAQIRMFDDSSQQTVKGIHLKLCGLTGGGMQGPFSGPAGAPAMPSAMPPMIRPPQQRDIPSLSGTAPYVAPPQQVIIQRGAVVPVQPPIAAAPAQVARPASSSPKGGGKKEECVTM